MKAIQYCKPGSKWSGIGNIIQGHIDPLGFSTVRAYAGHGVGTRFHMSPYILHFANTDDSYGEMKPGNIFTIEPMINEGTDASEIWDDEWTVATGDGLRSA